MNWVAPIKDEETLKRFGETLKEVDYKYYIMFELGVGTGLQLQDILSFKNKDVTDKKEITVEIGTKNIKNTFKISFNLPFLLISFIIIQSYYYTTLWEDYHACRTKNTKKRKVSDVCLTLWQLTFCRNRTYHGNCNQFPGCFA